MMSVPDCIVAVTRRHEQFSNLEHCSTLKSAE